MADTWAQDIANQFKKRDNPKPISNCIGVNLPIPHTNLTVLVSQDFFTVRIRREVA